MKFESWRYNYSVDMDSIGIDHLGLLRHYCLHQDAPKVALQLKSGAKWEEVSRNFRESW